MYEIGIMDQLILLSLLVGLVYGLCGLALAFLALTDLEWRQLIADRLRQEINKFKVQSLKFKVKQPETRQKPTTLNVEL